MHIAVCMDNAADRKQLERLLGRSTDRRIAEDESFPFYIQSYGNKEALLRRPHMYDLFFIDLLNDDMNSVELIRQLRTLGVTASIVLCPGRVDLRHELREEDEVMILEQPIIADRLEEVIDIAVERVKAKVPMIELRTNIETLKVLPGDFLFAERKKDITEISLADGRVIETTERLENMWGRVAVFKELSYLPDSIIVNITYVDSVGFSGVKLKNGIRYKAKRDGLKRLEAKLKSGT